MKENKYIQTLIIFMALSLCLHLLVYLGAQEWFTEQQTRYTSTPIEITVLPSQNQKQFVTDPELGEVKEILEQQSQLLSRFTRQVKKQQVAQHTGPTKNRFKPNPSALNAQIEPKKNERSQSKNQDNNNLKVFNPRAEMNSSNSLTHSGNQPSTISEYIPNVEEGSFTALNTNQFSYYAFFQRINEQIRLRWVENIRKLSLQLPTSIVNNLALLPRETHVELVLDKNGNFLNAFIDKTSGARFLDDASVNAFIDAAPFLNPPSDLINEEGFIRLNYSFRVVWRPQYVARDKSRGK